jgi:bifunctional DNA-binding transcriptional regulator/antitoxin component of YhaV-PrlF toxin-antitoxin module
LATLQTRISRRVCSKEYLKSELTIPRELLRQLGWLDNQSVEFKVYGGNKLLLVPTQPKPKPVKLTFDAFASAVLGILSLQPQGSTWSRIRQLAGLQGRTPNPTWVYRLEKEYGLQRTRDKTLQVLWKLNQQARQYLPAHPNM